MTHASTLALVLVALLAGACCKMGSEPCPADETPEKTSKATPVGKAAKPADSPKQADPAVNKGDPMDLAGAMLDAAAVGAPAPTGDGSRLLSVSKKKAPEGVEPDKDKEKKEKAKQE